MRFSTKWSFALLCCLVSSWAPTEAQELGGRFTPQTLQFVCRSQQSRLAGSCNISLERGESTLLLSGNWPLPPNIHLIFTLGSSLRVEGGILAFQGASIEAPRGQRIFPNGDRVTELAAARPEWFAPTADQHDVVPASAVAAAYKATVPWGAIYLERRTYASPFAGCAGMQSLTFDSPRTFVGEARPVPDVSLSPHRLQGGTILVGGILGSAPLRMAHLGIDVGPSLIKRGFSGCEPHGVFILRPSRGVASGDFIQDVSVLTTGASNVHSVMLEGHEAVEVQNLWVWTLGGTHGLIIKSSRSVVDGLHCFGASSDCLLLKSDYATNLAGRAVQDRICHVDIEPLSTGKPVGGIVLDSTWDSVRSIQLTGIREVGTSYAINIVGSHFFHAMDIDVQNWTAENTWQSCLLSRGTDGLHVSDFRCGLLPSAEGGITLVNSNHVLLQRGAITCDGDISACGIGRTNGITEWGSTVSTKRVEVNGLGGYALRGPEALSNGAGIQLHGMGERNLEVFRPSLADRWRFFSGQFKPSLRILYTMVVSRPVLLAFTGAVCSVAGSLLLFLLFGPRVRRKRSLP